MPPLALGRFMAHKHVFPSSTSSGGSSHEIALIAICCVCGLVREKKTFTAQSDRWITCRAYEQKYGVNLMVSTLTHTYCSGCYRNFMQRVRPHRQAASFVTT